MCLGVQHPVVQADEVSVRVQKVIILERLRQPEALHGVNGRGRAVLTVNQVHCCIGDLASRVFDDRLPHLPSLFLPNWVASDPVHVPDGLNRLRPIMGKQDCQFGGRGRDHAGY